MKNTKELSFEELKRRCDPESLGFKKTSELEPFCGIIGQERALEAIKAATKIKEKGFNLFVCGSMGIGKTSYVLSVINKVAKTEPIPNDYCYVYNFDNPNEPIAISLPAGEGLEFKLDMNRFITKVLEKISKDLTGEKYEADKKHIIEKYTKIKENLMSELEKETYSEGFKIRITETGVYFSPVVDGKVLNEQDFSKLDSSIKKDFEQKSPKIQEQTMDALRKIDIIEKEAKSVVEEWEKNISTFDITKCMNDIKIKFKNNLKIQNFLYAVQEDILKNIELFKKYDKSAQEKTNQMPSIKTPIPTTAFGLNKPWENYRVNLIIDNDILTHAPVVVCKTPNYFDLFGKLEFESTMGGVKTNYNMLKPGLIHKANGGYIIVNINDILSSQPTWTAFKRVISTQELSIDSSRDIAQPVTLANLKPEAIPINCEFILIGSEGHYQKLCALDPDFKKLFKIKADFDDTYDRNDENTLKLARYTAYICKKYNLLPLNAPAVAEVIEYSSKCASDKNKFTAIVQDIIDLLIEANYIAIENKKRVISNKEIVDAIKTRSNRYSKYDEALKSMINDGTILISTKGEKIGQINGLTILNNGDLSFGKPVRITANTFIGKSGIVNIEREVLLSGTSHSKGVFILSAYIGEKYAQDMPLSLTASICFEQLYNGVDGDSASSTELYAILSSLASVPIKQSLAVTGSVNQKGEIQPIGGVTEKIEGYFNVCKKNGLTGEEGVLIPYQNVKNLSLKDEIIEAVKSKKFHIYPVSTIDEGIELLTGLKAGKLTKNGIYEKDSINYLVHEKLKKYAENSIKYSN